MGQRFLSVENLPKGMLHPSREKQRKGQQKDGYYAS